MKTRWGSCTPAKRTIRLNTELATRRPELLEYIVVHELVHLLEASHNARFYELMDLHMPGWKAHRKELNREPVRAEVLRGRAGGTGPVDGRLAEGKNRRRGSPVNHSFARTYNTHEMYACKWL